MGMDDQDHDRRAVDNLIDAVIRKLRSNPEMLQKSLNYGRLVWRCDRGRGKIDIKLELNI